MIPRTSWAVVLFLFAGCGDSSISAPVVPGPTTSDVLTQGVRVTVRSLYLPGQSNPAEDQYLFGYQVKIANVGESPVQLLSRHWIIFDAEGRREDVQGDGVVGNQPLLKPGEAFVYDSGCPLPTDWGSMQGYYVMQREDGTTFNADIGRFYLVMSPPKEQGPI